MISEFKYVVWQRNDGYVDATAKRLPSDYTVNGHDVTFKLLLETDSWDEAYKFILEARKGSADAN